MGKETVNLPPTEGVNPEFDGFDTASVETQLTWLLNSQKRAVAAVEQTLPDIAKAVRQAAQRLRGSSGRLIYCGAGCSIRIGVQDGVELVPTFGWPLNRLAYAIAGGPDALSVSVEGAEDDRGAAAQCIDAMALTAHDVVIGIAASGNTPFTDECLRQAREKGSLTVAVTSNPEAVMRSAADCALIAETGSEVLAGSTRLAAGTAQKATLNLFSTALMTALGRVLGNEMLCVQATNEKLKDRQVRILMHHADGWSGSAARALLAEAQWDLRIALLRAHGMSTDAARAALATEQPFQALLASARD